MTGSCQKPSGCLAAALRHSPDRFSAESQFLLVFLFSCAADFSIFRLSIEMDKRGQAKLIMAPLIRLKEDSVEEDRKFQKLETSLNFSAQTLDFLI